MLAYDTKSVPQAFGLENTGVICYFNSLLQAIASCSSLVATALERGDYMRKTRTGAAMLAFFQAAVRAGSSTDSVRSHSNTVLGALIADLAERRPKVYFGRGQESASEALVLLLDMMEAQADSKSDTEPPITGLLTGRYRCYSVCHGCRDKIAAKEDYAVCFDLFHLASAKDRPTTPGEFERALRHHVSQGGGDLICPNCDKRSVTSRVYDLLMIPEILVLQFNRYDSGLGGGTRESLYFPERFSVPSKKSGRLAYQLVAQVEHAGTQSGGHYWARALRAGGAVWQLNDTIVTPATFSPSGGTYLLFYHYAGVVGAEPGGAPAPPSRPEEPLASPTGSAGSATSSIGSAGLAAASSSGAPSLAAATPSVTPTGTGLQAASGNSSESVPPGPAAVASASAISY